VVEVVGLMVTGTAVAMVAIIVVVAAAVVLGVPSLTDEGESVCDDPVIFLALG
jgi:hypothetical protein